MGAGGVIADAEHRSDGALSGDDELKPLGLRF